MHKGAEQLKPFDEMSDGKDPVLRPSLHVRIGLENMPQILTHSSVYCILYIYESSSKSL